MLEGFSGTGKTTLAKMLEARDWMRLQESAHALPDHVPVLDKGDTRSDYSLLGATLAYVSTVSRMRKDRNVVSEGYLLSDLAYAKVRMALGLSSAYPSMLSICREVLADGCARPDLYVQLSSRPGESGTKVPATGAAKELFRTRYYEALSEVHTELGETDVVSLSTEPDAASTLDKVLAVIKERGLA